MTLLPRQAGEGQSKSYAFLELDFPGPGSPGQWEGGRFSLELSFDSENTVQLPLALYDPASRLRFTKASEPARGRVSLSYSFDAYPGDCEDNAGPWKLVMHKRILGESLSIRLVPGFQAAPEGKALPEAASKETAPPQACGEPPLAFDSAVLDPRPGWYCGELHLHSHMSTGRTDIRTIRAAALEQGLDFLALTDHFTPYHWQGIEALGARGEKPLFLRSAEVAGDKGHANLHGLASWPDPFPDDEDGAVQAFLGRKVCRTMEEAADFVHSQSGLFCLNHPLSAGVSWRYEDFPLQKADLIETACLPDGPVSFLYPTLWDRLLCQGLKPFAVGSSDSHDPNHKGPWALGVIRNWVYASSLSREGILEGFKAGRAYVAIGPARLDFTAQVLGAGKDPGAVASMGQTLRMGREDRAVFNASLRNHPSGNLFIYKDGLLLETKSLGAAQAPESGPDSDSSRVVFEASGKDIRPGGSFFRLEFHEDLEKAAYHGMAYRDHRSLRVLSNPIFLEAMA